MRCICNNVIIINVFADAWNIMHESGNIRNVNSKLNITMQKFPRMSLELCLLLSKLLLKRSRI